MCAASCGSTPGTTAFKIGECACLRLKLASNNKGWRHAGDSFGGFQRGGGGPTCKYLGCRITAEHVQVLCIQGDGTIVIVTQGQDMHPPIAFSGAKHSCHAKEPRHNLLFSPKTSSTRLAQDPASTSSSQIGCNKCRRKGGLCQELRLFFARHNQ